MKQRRSHEQASQNNLSIEKYGDKTVEKEECEDQLLTEYGLLMTLFVAGVVGLTTAANAQKLLPRRFGLLDLALLGIATHKLSRLVAKDRITGIIRAPFVSYKRSAGDGEVEEEPRGRGFQRGIGTLLSCPYCMGPWCATVLGFGMLFAPSTTRFFASILTSVAASDFLHRAYSATKKS